MSRFPDGSRVCFIGDSITADNTILKRVIAYYNKTYPHSGIRFFNCGVAGGTAGFAVESFASDVLVHKPTHAVVAFGINDSNRELLREPRSEARYRALTKAYETYKENISRLIDMLKDNGVETVLCTPIPYDEYTATEESALQGGFSLMLGYADFIRSFAKENGIALCDHHEYMSRMLQTEDCYSPDHIHPNGHGYYLMAKNLLDYQGLDIGKEGPCPDYLDAWHENVKSLRRVLATECMIVREFDMPTEEKLRMINDKIQRCDWGQPVFESYIRFYAEDKPREAWLYAEIDRLYETDILTK